ncbi:hypothetical protein IFM89_023214 [Coptis chinensis]|uniref:Uncharacterized protein n=1 Tax=Coptis chinensis TaxID=261450 RepID=A0A835I4X1_9MAGN|nr:hypothetical protein IFM89_023214 [Coptis chinensis]
MKVVPPWLIKQGMNLTSEQRGDLKQDLEMENSSATEGSSEDKKSRVDEKDEKTYYAALLKRQQEQEEAARREHQELEEANDISNEEIPSDRRVGMKSRREENGSDAVVWEEAPTSVRVVLMGCEPFYFQYWICFAYLFSNFAALFACGPS